MIYFILSFILACFDIIGLWIFQDVIEFWVFAMMSLGSGICSNITFL